MPNRSTRRPSDTKPDCTSCASIPHMYEFRIAQAAKFGLPRLRGKPPTGSRTRKVWGAAHVSNSGTTCVHDPVMQHTPAIPKRGNASSVRRVSAGFDCFSSVSPDGEFGTRVLCESINLGSVALYNRTVKRSDSIQLERPSLFVVLLVSQQRISYRSIIGISSYLSASGSSATIDRLFVTFGAFCTALPKYRATVLPEPLHERPTLRRPALVAALPISPEGLDRCECWRTSTPLMMPG